MYLGFHGCPFACNDAKNPNNVNLYEKLLHQVPFFTVFEKVGIESESPDLLNLSHQTILCFSHEIYYIIQRRKLLHLGPLLHLGTFITLEASTKHDKNISYDLSPENL